ncbi:MAG: J domain-containing protein, partial [Candidatus Thermoplasmatota archaeon]|nr:J domain-containing protein [Candidatus Thermoplasmatota archaeon]
KEKEAPKVEDEEDDGLPDLEMPKVVYVDRHVFVKVGNNKYDGGDDPTEDPYKVIGVRRDDDHAAIERAFREKIHLYHPDKFDKGPDWVREKAKEETMRLNRAYEKVMKGK